MKPLKIILFILVCFLTKSCANIVPLTGGPEDDTPPMLSKIESKKDKLILVFNENINLGDLNEIISNIYPSPTYEVKRNKLYITGIPKTEKKQLIYFNNSIQDLNANNPLQEYIYADHVGSDTFEYQGKVEFAFKPKESTKGCYVILTDKSVVINTVEDLYKYEFTKANEKGMYKFGFVKKPQGQQVFAFLDNNNNSIPDTGDYFGVSKTINADSNVKTYLHYFGNNLIFKDTTNTGIIKEVFHTVEKETINSATLTYKKAFNDTIFNYVNFSDSTILSKNDAVLENENISYLAKSKNAPIDKYPEPFFSFDFNLGLDSFHPFINSIGDTLFIIRVIPKAEGSSITITQMDSIIRGSIIGKDVQLTVNQENKSFIVRNGTYALFLYLDSNTNGKYDPPGVFPFHSGEYIIYNMKDIDIGPKLDVEISAKP